MQILIVGYYPREIIQPIKDKYPEDKVIMMSPMSDQLDATKKIHLYQQVIKLVDYVLFFYEWEEEKNRLTRMVYDYCHMINKPVIYCSRERKP